MENMKLIQLKNIINEEMKNLLEQDMEDALEKAMYNVYSDMYLIPSSNWRLRNTTPMLTPDGKIYSGKIGEIHTIRTVDYDLLHNGEVVTECNGETYSIETDDFRNSFEMISDEEGLKLNNESVMLENKFSVQGKYLKFGKSITSIPDIRTGDSNAIIVSSTNNENCKIYINTKGEIYFDSNKYDKKFNNLNELINFLNENNFKYVGIDTL